MKILSNLFGSPHQSPSDLEELKDLMIWAKSEGFVMKNVKIGAIEMEIEPFLAYEVPKDTEIAGQSEKEDGSFVEEEQPAPTDEELFLSSGAPATD